MLLTPIETVVLQALSASKEPKTADALFKTFKKSLSQVKAEEFKAVLEQMAQKGIIFSRPPLRKNTACRYSSVSPLEDAKSRILKKLTAGKGHATLAQVRQSLAKSDQEHFDEAAAELMKEQKIWELVQNRRRYLYNHVPRPSDYLSGDDIKSLKRVVQLAQMFRKDKLTLEDIYAFLEGSLKKADDNDELPEKLLLKWYKDDLPSLEGMTTVPLSRTWSRYKLWAQGSQKEPSLDTFHAAIRNLEQSGLVQLTAHSGTEPIAPEAKKIALTGDRGEVLYFWRLRNEGSDD